MKKRKTLVIVLLLCSFTIFNTAIGATFEDTLSTLPSKSVFESKALFSQRKFKALSFWANQTTRLWTSWVKNNDPGGTAKVALPNQALAKLSLGRDIEAINKALLSGTVYSEVGTHTSLPFGLMRKGDYDFTLLWLTNLIHTFWNNPNLTEETKQYVASTLLNQEGSDHINKRFWLFVPETENHILMTETSRYLKNDIVHRYGTKYSTYNLPENEYNNESNGFNRWMVNHLDMFLTNDFDEYNSKPYESFTTVAIQNLYEHASDGKVREKAKAILDYQALKFAFTSLDLRRVVPFRRQESKASLDNVYSEDPAAARFALLSGNYTNNNADSDSYLSTHVWPIPALGTYRMPDSVLDFMIEKDHHAYLYRASYDNVEVVSSEKNYLISGGGIYHNKYIFPFMSHENGNTRPTVLMTRGGSPLISEMIRFEGRKDTEKVNNTCVYEGFACGVNLVIPEIYIPLSGDWFAEDGWGFLDLEDVYVAIYILFTTDYSGVNNGGFFEVVNKNEVASYDAFRASVREKNQDLQFLPFGTNEYTLQSGKSVTFEVMPERSNKIFKRALPKENLKEWKIKGVRENGEIVELETRFKKWPLIGAYDTRTHEKLIYVEVNDDITIYNPFLEETLVLK